MLLIPLKSPAGACTVFTASIGDTVLFGNNEDWPDTNTHVWFQPATETEYGGVYFGFGDYYAQGGMNDQGLCFDATAIPELKMRPQPGKLNTVRFGERVLETCATAEEVIQFVDQHDLSGLGKAQFLFADKKGNSIIVCPGTDGEMNIIQKEGVYQVITNFNVTYPQLGGYPCWRYSAASRMLKEIENEENLTVEYFAEILKNVFQRHTAYSTIYDPVNGLIYLYNQHNFDEVHVFNLKDELEKGNCSYYIPMFFSKEPEEQEAPDEPTESEEPSPESSEEPATHKHADSQDSPAPSEQVSEGLSPLFYVAGVVVLIGIVTVLRKIRDDPQK